VLNIKDIATHGKQSMFGSEGCPLPLETSDALPKPESGATQLSLTIYFMLIRNDGTHQHLFARGFARLCNAQTSSEANGEASQTQNHLDLHLRHGSYIHS